MTITPPRKPPAKKKKSGLSDGARIAWAIVLTPFGLAAGVLALGALMAALMVALALVLTLPVWVLWNVGVTEADELVGLSLSNIGLVQAFAVALVMGLLRFVFSGGPTTSSAPKRFNDRKADSK